MKVCIIVEGCYPYIIGGVSSWVQMLTENTPHVEFIIQALIVSRADSGKFVYKLPENVTEVREIYLQDDDWIGNGKKRGLLTAEEFGALRSLLFGKNIEWERLFKMFADPCLSIDGLLMGEDFLNISKEYYEAQYSRVVFSDFLWTMRSMYLPLFYVLKNQPPYADLYHSIATGYSGVWGSMAKAMHGRPLLISEHGIYTREREEEIIKADWVKGIYKDIWIQQFNKFSLCAYRYADKVTSLFEGARQLQIELGCPPEKTLVTPNGINAALFEGLPQKAPDDSFINLGAVLRVSPIKDVKTMINAFYYAKKVEPRLKLWIMGPTDEMPEYSKECMELVENLGVQDIEFTGRINVRDYIAKMDIILLTSISEGQPLSILEAFAAKRPVIATNVGNCYGLIYGERDQYGEAGVVVPVMSVSKVADAIVTLAQDDALRRKMGEIGYRRTVDFYSTKDFLRQYHDLYEEITAPYGIKPDRTPFALHPQDGAGGRGPGA